MSITQYAYAGTIDHLFIVLNLVVALGLKISFRLLTMINPDSF